MAKAFSLASWNVENFRGREGRVADIVGFLAGQNGGPDVFALYEVASNAVFGALVEAMPGYQFHITEGRQTQEILVGVKQGLTAFFTQRTEFKSGNTYLRPGALLTVTVAGSNYPLLFLHTKSHTTAVGFGLRDEMLRRAFRLKRVLDKSEGGVGSANFMFLGDLNTMGLEYPYDNDIKPESEIKRLDGRAGRNRMKRLKKNAPATWWNGPGSTYPPGDLDHVVAAKHLNFRKFDGADTDVRGWPKEPNDQAKKDWIDRFSDHGMLYIEVQRV